MATVLVTGTVAPARAACNKPVDQITAMNLADSVFVGQVMELSDVNRVATMRVLEIWKGPDLGAQVTVNGSFSGSPQVLLSDRTYVLGATYLVVPFGRRSPFFDEACSGTRPYSPLGGQIPPQFQNAVGTPTARMPAAFGVADDTSDGSGRAGSLLIGGGVLAALGLVLLARRRRKRAAAAATKDASAQPYRPPGTPATLRRKPVREPVEPKVFAAVAGRKTRRSQRTPRVPPADNMRSSRFSKSGLANLEAVRKKTRRIREKQRKAR